MRLHLGLVVAASLFSFIIASPAALPAAPSRTIDIGTIVGQTSVATLAATSTATVQQYLGIPFAAVPTGSLRFLPPASATKLSAPFKATALPPACIQQFFGAENGVTGEQMQYNNPHGPPPPESEDCLYLNVFAPGNASPSTKKPVMLWIFGGELQFGTGSYRWYNGSYFAGFQDIMVVTYNFRNNFFGFPGDAPGIPVGQGNVGLLDTRSVLQWIQKNIAAFGGDPTQVTIVGESSGGWIVKQLMAFPPNPLPFRGAIIESPETNVSSTTRPEFNRITSHFGCTTLDCMRKIPASDLKYYLDTNTDLFNPVSDNITCNVDIRSRVTNKQMVNIPFMSGTNSDEGTPFVAGAGFGPGSNPNSSAIAQFFEDYFPQYPFLYQISIAFITAFSDGAYYGLSRVVTDAAFDCPLSAFTSTALANGYTDQWRYYYTATFPNMEDFPNAGAFHSAEIPQVWGTYDFPSSTGTYTQQQVALSKTMNTAWANFIKNPKSGPGSSWPKLNSFYSNVAKFQTSGMTTTNTEEPDINCPMYAPLIAADGF